MEPIYLPEVWVYPLALLLPLINAAIVRANTSVEDIHFGVSIALAIALALADELASGKFTVEGLIVSAVTAFIISATAYLAKFEGWKINEKVLPEVGIG